MLCRICMDRSFDTALFPCGHAVACLDCARRCERCPLCRADIDHCRTIYLPIELTHVDKHNPKLLSESIEPSYSTSSAEEIQKRILASESSMVNSNDIWERCDTKFDAFQKLFSKILKRQVAKTLHWVLSHFPHIIFSTSFAISYVSVIIFVACLLNSLLFF